ncbi:MAG TPA: hypothetical protein VJ882_05620 [Desulfuromonadales bacterium]|nr:hypothetical protein [Desulfuromonadales bacterium]
MKKAILLVLTVLVASCAPPPKPVPLLPDLEQRLLGQLRDSGRKFSSLEGIAEVEVVDTERKVSTTQILFAKKPGQLRTEILSPFGTPLMLIATDGQALTAYLPGDGLFYRGDATDANIQRLLRIPLRLEDLVDIVLYAPPLFDYNSVEAGVESGSHYLLTLDEEGAYRQEFRFDRELHLVGARYRMGKEKLLEVNYEFRSPGSVYPQKIKAEMPQHESSLAVTFSDVETNIDIGPDRFLLSPPAGVKTRPLPAKY